MPTSKFPIPERACNSMPAANRVVHLADLGKRMGAIVGITAALSLKFTPCLDPLSKGRNSMTLRKIRASWTLVVSLCIVALAGLPANRSVAAGLVNNATIVNVQPTAQGNSLGQVGAFFVYVNVAPTGGQAAQHMGRPPNASLSIRILR